MWTQLTLESKKDILAVLQLSLQVIRKPPHALKNAIIHNQLPKLTLF